MPVQAVCPHCQSTFTLSDQQAGKKVRCTSCQGVFTVPGAGEEEDSILDVELVEDEHEQPTPRPTPRSSAPVQVEVVEPTRSQAVQAEPPVLKPRAPSPPSRVAKAPPSKASPTRVPARPPATSTSSTRSTSKHRPLRDDTDEEVVEKPRRKSSIDDDEKPRRKSKAGGGSSTPWIVGGLLAVVALLLVGGGVLAFVLTRGKAEPSPEVASNTTPSDTSPPPAPTSPGTTPVVPVSPVPVAQPTPVEPTPLPPVPPPPTPPAPDRTKPTAPDDDDPPPSSGGNGTLSEAAREKVKKATVYLRVTNADGSVAAGTGFFGTKEARNIILTNAHVVGMLAPESPRPRKVEVFINSGENDEHKTTARILGVDRSSDLAVLDVGTTDNMPEPLHVKSAKGLHELDPLFVFGFPLGESLGKEITIRPSSVSSLRKKAGQLDKVQVNGGMDPGNSGGPVVDPRGHVVGVAVSGIPGHMINFAIPGDRVHTILNGRISEFATGIPYRSGTQIGVPVTMRMIDPRGKIREVGVDLWTGDPPRDRKKTSRPPAVNDTPASEPGDSPRVRYPLTYRTDTSEGKADILLPELPEGKVYWQQPVWVDANGERHWVSGSVLAVKPEDAVERAPALLALRFPARASRPVTLSTLNTFKIGADDDDPFVVRTRVYFQEQVLSSSPMGGASLRLQYRKAEKQLIRPNRPPIDSPQLEVLGEDLKAASALLEVDAVGNLTQNTLHLDSNVLLANYRRTRTMLGPRELIRLQKSLEKFHKPVQDALEAMAIKLPGDTVQPGQTWTGIRSLPIDNPGSYENGDLNMTYTYVGQRKQKERDQAVILLSGVARGRGKKADAVGGQATGRALVDLATGQITFSEVKVVLDLTVSLSDKEEEDEEKGRTLKVIATLLVKLERQI